MLCIFVFSLFIFTQNFWIKHTLFATLNAALNVHLVAVMLAVLWACEATMSEEKKTIKILYRTLMHSDDANKNEKVTEVVVRVVMCSILDFCIFRFVNSFISSRQWKSSSLAGFSTLIGSFASE